MVDSFLNNSKFAEPLSDMLERTTIDTPLDDLQTQPSFLPKLTDLSLEIVPRTELILKLIRARWKAPNHQETADRSSPDCLSPTHNQGNGSTEGDDGSRGDMDCREDGRDLYDKVDGRPVGIDGRQGKSVVDKELEASKWRGVYLSLTTQTQNVARVISSRDVQGAKDEGNAGGVAIELRDVDEAPPSIAKVQAQTAEANTTEDNPAILDLTLSDTSSKPSPNSNNGGGKIVEEL
ncbi:hypothetical protein J3R30DRAFT_3739118 [Lentinula aciculospora]|uniref:Uncharacterized protein n=1 Tax=Lentinula aciculospora TaxID=153920 RepID=A0A9W8ZXI4_9AGAR|nr:hypothetical protein J3R30DRAFT_3739118 [Lentinula aciculospora]